MYYNMYVTWHRLYNAVTAQWAGAGRTRARFCPSRVLARNTLFTWNLLYTR